MRVNKNRIGRESVYGNAQAKSSKNKKLAPESVSANSDWRLHPVIVPLVAGAAVAIFFVTVIIPVYTQSLQARLQSVTEERDQLFALDKQRRENFNRLSKQAADAETSAASIILKDIFADNDVFPLGWREVRIGDDSTLIAQKYSTVDLTSPAWITVRQEKSPIFSQAAFYQRGYEHKGPVTHVLYFMDDDDPSSPPTGRPILTVKEKHDVVLKQLTERFGVPTADVEKLTNSPELIWNAMSYRLELQAKIFHISATCDTVAAVKLQRGLKLDKKIFCL
jgi:hypothetical protein